MNFTELVGSNNKEPGTSFTQQVARPAKQDNGTRDLIAKHLNSARHAVNVRIVQLQNATHKSHKPGKRDQIMSQLHDLTAYQGMLNSLAGSLDSGDHSVCYQSYLSSVAHVTSRIHDTLHEHPHEEHHDVEFHMAALPVQDNPTLQTLEAREQELGLIISIAYALREQNEEVKAASKDFARAIKVSAAPKKGVSAEGDAIREAAKESLREEVKEEVKAKAMAEGVKMDAKAEETIIHSKAWERWQTIKEKAGEIHGVAVQHWNTRDEKINAVRSKIQTVYADMVQPHFDRWRAAAAEHGETFAASIEQMNQFAGSLNSAIESYPSSEVQSLEALHSHINELSSQCNTCAGTLTRTLDVLHKQHDHIIKAKDGVIRALKGDRTGLEDAAKILNLDEMKKLYGEIGEFHEKHLSGMGIATKWLKDSIDDFSVILGAVTKGIGKDSGPGGNAFSA